MARQMNEDVAHQVDLRMLRDIIKVVRQLKVPSGDDGGLSIDDKLAKIGQMAALAAVGAINDPDIRLRAMPLIRGM